MRRLEGVRVHVIEIPRKISPVRDAAALFRITAFFHRERFDAVHSATPKAGLLGAVAGWLARVPVRLHTFTGQPWVERTGLVRLLAKSADWITARMTTRCYADSASQRDFLVAQKVVRAGCIHTLGSGSIAGVDLQRFDRARWSGQKAAVCAELGLSAGVKIVTFIGRLTRDKGVLELLAAARALQKRGSPAVFLLIGPVESEGDDEVDHALASAASNVRRLGYRAEPERYLAASELLCLPSYREGFPIVVIEAAAMGVPTIGTDIVGLNDSVVDGRTGVLVPAKNMQALEHALLQLLTDDEQRRALGEAARRRVAMEFDAEIVNRLVIAEYGVDPGA